MLCVRASIVVCTYSAAVLPGQCCEPTTGNRFFRSFFCRFFQPKTDFFLSIFRLGEKNETGKPTRFSSVFFFLLSPTPIKPLYLYRMETLLLMYGYARRDTRHSQHTAHAQSLHAAHIPQQHSSIAARHTQAAVAAGSSSRTGHRAPRDWEG